MTNGARRAKIPSTGTDGDRGPQGSSPTEMARIAESALVGRAPRTAPELRRGQKRRRFARVMGPDEVKNQGGTVPEADQQAPLERKFVGGVFFVPRKAKEKKSA